MIRLNILLLRKEVNQNWSELESEEFRSAACLWGGSFQFFWKSITFPSYLLLYCTRILLYSLATQPSIIEPLYWHFNVQWRLELPQRFQLKKIQDENGERKKKKKKIGLKVSSKGIYGCLSPSFSSSSLLKGSLKHPFKQTCFAEFLGGTQMALFQWCSDK